MKRHDWREVGMEPTQRNHLEEEVANIIRLSESIAQPVSMEAYALSAALEREFERSRSKHRGQAISHPIETDEWGIYAREDDDRAHLLVFVMIAVAAAVIGFTFGWWLWG